jgi:RNA polymerase sporulation-specific sigma factor
MLTEQEAQKLMIELISLREIVQNSDDPDVLDKLKKHEQLCIENFKYLIFMKTGRYKSFANYDDLNQEGFEALLKAMKNYNPTKGSFFWWAHKYIDTRISRSANLHTTIRYPLKVAKINIPHKETSLPLLVEEQYCPDKRLEELQSVNSIQTAMCFLTEEQKNIVNLSFGFGGDKPLSINKICKKLNISRSYCIRLIDSALDVIKEKIKL